jgi:hypothetical protein
MVPELSRRWKTAFLLVTLNYPRAKSLLLTGCWKSARKNFLHHHHLQQAADQVDLPVRPADPPVLPAADLKL